MSDLGSRINYKQLLERHGCIRIPIIQRDYAQGRPEEKEVRNDFLQSIKIALDKPSGDPSLPFNLDFIYGSVEGVDDSRFLPLDGQQRLTTLFLLHWYLAWKDERWDEFTRMFSAKGKSRFSYSVRPSSNEFFDAFVRFQPQDTPENVSQLSVVITDQPWYFRSWLLDPSIQSSLVMLDAIHALFASSSNLFERLVCDQRPAITFQLLDLDNFGLSDDLYIKMNSRGKPLTPFETFKARYERELKDQFANCSINFLGPNQTVSDYVAWRIDNAWADLFWLYRDQVSNQFDGAIMNIFSVVALVTRQPDSEQFIEDVDRLRQIFGALTYSDFHDRGWLDEKFTLVLIRLLDAWSMGGDRLKIQLPNTKYFDECEFFQRIVSKKKALSYTEVVQSAAYILFLDFNVGDFNCNQFQDWMRVVFNLSENTEYNRAEDLQRSLSGLIELLPQSKNILVFLANVNSAISGFSKQQLDEERLKAQLILAQDGWAEIIYNAEGHGYFRGQIEFLLDYSGIKSDLTPQNWNESQHYTFQSEFQKYTQKSFTMFGDKGLKVLPNSLWERALLCFGNYMLPKGRNSSFLVNTITDQASWKRLLRGRGENAPQARSVLKQLLDYIDIHVDLSKQLDELIDDSKGLEPWIDALVKSPYAIGYCASRCIRMEHGGQIYLLKRTQMNGMHSELFTYSLYKNLLADFTRFEPLKLGHYVEVSDSESEPHFCISFIKNNVPLGVSIRFDREGVAISYPNLGADLQEDVVKELHELGLMKDNTIQKICVDRDTFAVWLLELARSVTGHEAGETIHG